MPDSLSGKTKEKVTGSDKGQLQPPAINLPKGGGAIKGIGEKFAANPVTGTGSMTVPIATSPGRSGFGPQLSLSYDSGSGNGPFGFGWSLSLPSITRKTDKGLPQYWDAEDSDEFILSGAEDLVPVFKKKANGEWELDGDGRHVIDEIDRDGYKVRRYRPRIEGLFARIERWTKVTNGEIHWRSISKDNITTLYGKDNNSRIFDPAEIPESGDIKEAEPSRIFSWLICQSYDDKGNAIIYEHAKENSQRIFEDQRGQSIALAHERNRDDKSRSANRYLKRIKYGNRSPNRDLASWQATDPTELEDWMFEVVFDYLTEKKDEEVYGQHYKQLAPDVDGQLFIEGASTTELKAWNVRQDPFSIYRAGFEVRTYRLCHRVLMFHHFPDDLGIDDYLVRSTEFTYEQSPIASFIKSVTQSGYRYIQDQEKYLKKSLPPLELDYSKADIQEDVQEIDAESLENLPIGLDGSRYQWVDLDGEGLSGILTEQANAWFYKPNLGNGQFGPLELVATVPSLAALSSGQQQLLDLAGDGQLDIVQFSGPTPGFYERTHDQNWKSFKPFSHLPNIAWDDSNLRFVDLNGDGHADVLITENEVFTWYPSLAEEGFGQAEKVRQALEEEKGPKLVFADGTQSIYLADLSGDGLSDLARIRNGEVCYWPSLGYGRFGAKVTMDNAPWFDSQDQFDQQRIRTADIDGSGTTDIIYLGRDEISIYRNECGNSWARPEPLTSFPQTDNLSSVMALDLLGNGTACLVWSSPLPAVNGKPMRYIDLMGGQKPHLLIKTVNNLGAKTHVHYTASSKFYLADKKAGTPWITKIPFPVHVVEKVETYDCISKNRFTTCYAYHHGYFDGNEREFRGFGMVDQWDTEEYASLLETVLPTGDNINPESHVPPIHTKTWFHTAAWLENAKISRQFEKEYFSEPGLNDDELNQLLLPDTVLPDELTVEEQKEACRALKGSILRQEIYADDNSEKRQFPYSVSEGNYTIRRLQPRDQNKHGVFFVHPLETIDYHYERNPSDPITSHQITLHVDDYGNVKKSVVIGYGRREIVIGLDENEERTENPNPGFEGLTEEDVNKQTKVWITYTEADYTNLIDDEADHWRTPLPSEVRTYELTGYEDNTDRNRFTKEDFIEEADDVIILVDMEEIPYEQKATGDIQKRLIERVRTLYRANNLEQLLEKDDLEELALPGESYTLAFTPGLLQSVYRRQNSDETWENLLPEGDDFTDLIGGKSGDQGGYIDLDEDGCWWIPSGRIYYYENVETDHPDDTTADELNAARNHFFLPRKFANPFNHCTTLHYDDHDLLMTSTSDALDNLNEAKNDYRVLQPEKMKDPNNNWTHVAFDAFGMVSGTALMGKVNDAFVSTEGDSLEDFEPDLTLAQIEAFLNNPREPDEDTPNGSKASSITRSLLHNATTRVVYNLNYNKENNQPSFAAIIAREKHYRELAAEEESKVQVSFSYSDGFGREIQKKIQAEAGTVPKRDNGNIIIGADGQPEMTEEIIRPRWVGSGWTVFNNKGKPVRQYEPFFSDTHRIDKDAKIGVSPVLFYDPADRVIATIHPNHSYEKVLFDAWMQKTWDVNDTIKSDPRNDADISGYVEEYFKKIAPAPANWKPWLQEREVDPNNPPEDTPSLIPDKKAAVRSLVHHDTPVWAHLDSLGRTFLSIVHNKFERRENDELVVHDEKHETRMFFDIEGNQQKIIDAKKEYNDSDGNSVIDELGRIVMQYDYDLLSNRIHQKSMEAGEHWMLNDIFGNSIRTWDSRRFIRRLTYDELRRPCCLYVTKNNQERLAEQTVYGEQQGIIGNHKTKVYQIYDGAGIVTSVSYDFKGNLLESRRELLPEYKHAINWDLNPVPSYGNYTNRIVYDAFNRPSSVTTPDNSIYRPIFNEANLLDKVDVNLRGERDNGQLQWTTFVSNVDYNAKGQRVLIVYGNDVATTYTYDPLTFRLKTIETTRPEGLNGISSQLFNNETIVQNLNYTYDPVGNIIHIADLALKAINYNNQLIEPISSYRYDSMYRLIEASGREHTGQTSYDLNPPNGDCRDFPFVGHRVHPNDLQALRNYIQKYIYDEVGNFQEINHVANGGSWTRHYTYEENSLIEPHKKNNRLTRTRVGNGINHRSDYTHDSHGNIASMPHLTTMNWDFEDQLQQINLGGGGTAYYVYDASGQRVRKVIESQNGVKQKERIYLGGFEIYREFNGNGRDEELERETLHIMDDKQRIALVETQTINAGGEVYTPIPLIRYQFSNHLGSACLELDGNGDLITYEEYHPYGNSSFQAGRNVAEVSLKRYRHTGKERDSESGLDYYGARYYASWLGRWLSADPFGLIDGLNLYLYVNSNPIIIFDSGGTNGTSVHELSDVLNHLDDSRAPLPTRSKPMTAGHKGEARKHGNKQAKAHGKKAGLKGTDYQAGHTAAARHSSESGITEEVWDEHQKNNMQDLHSRKGKGLNVTVTDQHGTEKIRTRHTSQEGLIDDAVDRVKRANNGALTPQGQLDAADEVNWRTENTNYEKTEIENAKKSEVIRYDDVNPDGTAKSNPKARETMDNLLAQADAKKAKKGGLKQAVKKIADNPKLAKAGAKLAKAGKQFAKAIPFLGAGAGVASAGYAASQGDRVGAALDTVGLVPVAGDIVDAARGGYALGEAAGELLVDTDQAMEHGDIAKAAMEKIGAGETVSNIVGGLAAAGSAIGQVALKTSPIGFLFW